MKYAIFAALVAVVVVVTQAIAGGYDLTYKSIDELSTLSAPASGDFLVIYDASVDDFKKIDALYYASAS